MDKETIEYIRAWARKAEHDLISAAIIMNSGHEEIPYDMVCFHCQQGVEKYIKAYLTYLDIMFTKTHNIGQLIELGRVSDQELRDYLKADILTPYGVAIRYPDDFYMPTTEEAKEAYDIAINVKKFVRRKMKDIL